MGRRSRFESRALEHAYERYIGKGPEKVAAFEEELANAQVARKIYDLRTKAGLTQKQLYPEDTFGRPVDLGTPETLRPEMRAAVERELIHVP
jgi:hypothetical protein